MTKNLFTQEDQRKMVEQFQRLASRNPDSV